jgi:hypothetical protein
MYVCLSRKENPPLDEVEKLKFIRLTGTPGKAKGKIRNPENFVPGGPKLGDGKCDV